MYEACRCEAYAWPHRPGGGLCRWPEPPLHRLTIPPSTWRPTRCRPLIGAAWNEGPELLEPVTQPLSQASLGLFTIRPT